MTSAQALRKMPNTHTKPRPGKCVQTDEFWSNGESVITTGHCSVDRTDSQLPCVCVFVHVFLDCWLSCVVEDTHTPLSVECVPASALYTHSLDIVSSS